jgi:hypothetical protein
MHTSPGELLVMSARECDEEGDIMDEGEPAKKTDMAYTG